MTAKSLNCWYSARWAEGLLAGGRKPNNANDILLRDLNLFNICTAARFKDWGASERGGSKNRKRTKRNHTKSKSFVPNGNLQTKNFLCSRNVIQNIFVRDLNISWFRRFVSSHFKQRDSFSTRLSMHKSLIFLPPAEPTANVNIYFTWWGDIYFSVVDFSFPFFSCGENATPLRSLVTECCKQNQSSSLMFDERC